MAEINLLKQKSATQGLILMLPKLLARFLILVLIAALGYYAYLYYQSSSVSSKILETQNLIQKNKTQVSQMKERDELLIRQQQLQNLDKLISSHVYWTKLFPELAKVTLKTANYSNLDADQDSNVSLSANLPTLTDLDKYLQVFNDPEFNKNFFNVRISSVHKVQLTESQTVISVQIKMNFNNNLIH